MAEERAQSAFFEAGPSDSGSASVLPESITKIPDVVVCPEASENEKGDVSITMACFVYQVAHSFKP